MKNELHVLKTYIELFIMSRPIYNIDLLKVVEVECERLKDIFFIEFNRAEKTIRAKEVLNWYRIKIIELADTLWASVKPSNTLGNLLPVVISLIQHLEHYYGHVLDKKHTLSAFETYQLNNYVTDELTSVKDRLVQKNISVPLHAQLIKAHHDLFKTGKYPAFCYSEKQYLNVFLPQLKLLANDERDKDWNRRLRQLLIKYNFNHLGIYKLIETEHDKNITSFKNPEEKLDRLFEKTLWIKQIQVIPDLAYTIHAESLKDLLLVHLKNQYSHLKEKLKIGKIIDHQKFHRNLNVNELSLDFHYRFHENEFGYKTKKEAAIAFINNNTSTKTTNISAHSINKFDKLEQHDAATKLYQMYQRILTRIAKDFDLKLW